MRAGSAECRLSRSGFTMEQLADQRRKDRLAALRDHGLIFIDKTRIVDDLVERVIMDEFDRQNREGRT